MAYFYRSLSFQKTFSFKNLKEIYQLSHRVEEWKNAWLNKTPPMLYFLNERSILDSRNNISGIIDITLCEYDLLQRLDRPMSLAELDLNEKSEEALKQLKAKKLVYQPGDCYFSLVMKSAPKLRTALIPETVNLF